MATEPFVCGTRPGSGNCKNVKDTIEESSTLFFHQTARRFTAAPLIAPFALGVGRKGKKPFDFPSPREMRCLCRYRRTAKSWPGLVDDRMVSRGNERSTFGIQPVAKKRAS